MIRHLPPDDSHSGFLAQRSAECEHLFIEKLSRVYGKIGPMNEQSRPQSSTPDAGQRSTGRILIDATRRWFVAPPRPHGHIVKDRTVSFLELFYDLVFVVLVAEVAHTFATHLTWTGVLDFSAVFGLIWVAWLNGSLYQDLHGGDDGRSRRYIFGQMLLLALLAVYAGHATTDGGVPFAVIYVILSCYLAYQWWVVRRVDQNEADRRIVRDYVIRLLALALVVGASTLLAPELRAWVWLATVLVLECTHAVWVPGGPARA